VFSVFTVKLSHGKAATHLIDTLHLRIDTLRVRHVFKHDLADLQSRVPEPLLESFDLGKLLDENDCERKLRITLRIDSRGRRNRSS
jgi:hypothetical protein